MQRMLALNAGVFADVAQAITTLGDPLVVLVLVVVLNWRHWMRVSVFLVGSMLLRLAYGALKNVIARDRPDAVQQLVHASGYAMPSGHAAGIAFVAVIVSVVHPRFRWWAAVAALLVGWSRVALGVHYPSDVLVGWIVGAAFGFGSLWVLRRLETGTNLAE